MYFIIPAVRRGAHIATSIGLLAVGIAVLLPGGAPAKKHSKVSAGKAERYVRATLGSRRLTTTRTHCHYGGGGFACQWRAKRVVRGWEFHCRGRAWRGPKRSSVQACRMAGPELAPLLPQESLGGWQPSFGFNEDWTSQVGRLDLAAGLASNTNRISFNWALAEPRRESFNWAPYDKVYTAMRYRGMSPLLAISGSPCWARPAQPCTADSGFPPDREHLEDWSRFIRQVVKRYPGIAGIEVWNEPNLSGFWQPEPSPKGYAKLLKVTSKAVRSTATGVPVIFGGLVPQFGPATRGMDSRKFQKIAYKSGAGRWVDAFAVHPYVFPSDDPNLILSVRLQMAVPKGIAAHYGYPGHAAVGDRVRPLHGRRGQALLQRPGHQARRPLPIAARDTRRAGRHPPPADRPQPQRSRLAGGNGDRHLPRKPEAGVLRAGPGAHGNLPVQVGVSATLGALARLGWKFHQERSRGPARRHRSNRPRSQDRGAVLTPETMEDTT